MSLARNFATLPDDSVCAVAKSKVGPWTEDQALERAPSPDLVAKYLAFETDLAVCAPRLRISASSASDAFSRASLSELLSSGFTYDTEIEEAPTMEAVLAKVGVQAEALDREEATMLGKLREGGMGLYTTEQEADDIALEIATKLGLTPGEVLGSWLRFMEASEAMGTKFDDTTGNLPPAKCKALLEAQFREAGADGASVPVMMTLGNLVDPHHGSCYRVFNTWREANAHRFAAVGTFEPPAGPSWKELADYALELSGRGAKEPPPSREPPVDETPSIKPANGATEGPQAQATETSAGCAVSSPRDDASLTGVLLVAAIALLSARRRRSS